MVRIPLIQLIGVHTFQVESCIYTFLSYCIEIFVNKCIFYIHLIVYEKKKNANFYNTADHNSEKTSVFFN